MSFGVQGDNEPADYSLKGYYIRVSDYGTIELSLAYCDCQFQCGVAQVCALLSAAKLHDCITDDKDDDDNDYDDDVCSSITFEQ